MGEWMETYIEMKNNEPNYEGKTTIREWKCKGVLDREGKCSNVIKSSIPRFFCDECMRYFKEKS